nr:hypothetical protein JVH1_2007 [Rhodococcus sp. JVH1]
MVAGSPSPFEDVNRNRTQPLSMPDRRFAIPIGICACGVVNAGGLRFVPR